MFSPHPVLGGGNNDTICSPLHITAPCRVDSSASSSDIFVPFHQVDHLPIVSFIAKHNDSPWWSPLAGSQRLHQVQAKMCSLLSPYKSTENFMSIRVWHGMLPLFGRLSTIDYPSTYGQGSSTCTWSETTWKSCPSLVLEDLYLFLCLILSLSFKWQMILVSPGRVHI